MSCGTGKSYTVPDFSRALFVIGKHWRWAVPAWGGLPGEPLPASTANSPIRAHQTEDILTRALMSLYDIITRWLRVDMQQRAVWQYVTDDDLLLVLRTQRVCKRRVSRTACQVCECLCPLWITGVSVSGHTRPRSLHTASVHV